MNEEDYQDMLSKGLINVEPVNFMFQWWYTFLNATRPMVLDDISIPSEN